MCLSFKWRLGFSEEGNARREGGVGMRPVRETAKLTLGFSGGDEQLRIPGGAAADSSICENGGGHSLEYGLCTWRS